MAHIFDEFPTRELILRFSPSQLAERLLLDLTGDSLSRHNFLLEVDRRYGNDDAVSKAFLLAWARLVSRGVLVEKPDPGWFFMTEEGEAEKKRIQIVGAPVPSAPQRIIGGRWKVEGELSSGGQGLTSLVTDFQASTGELYVLKELRNADDPQARQRFAAETKALASLNHPNILKVTAFDIDSTPPWYVSEHCAGRGLDKALLSDFAVETRLDLFLDVCRGLAAAHQAGITHRDLKPENILLRMATGPAVLGDFGICWFAESDEERLTRAHEDIGSSFCRAPELFDGPLENVAPSSDIYCLGKLLYWIVVGKGGRAGRLAREEFDRGAKNLESIFGDDRYSFINAVLARMITENPAERYRDAAEAYDACAKGFELFAAGYHPIDRAPRKCTHCGQGSYRERRGSATNTELSMRSDWHLYECSVCGHTLMFGKNARNNKWEPSSA